jgi:hypothetical protein
LAFVTTTLLLQMPVKTEPNEIDPASDIGMDKSLSLCVICFTGERGLTLHLRSDSEECVANDGGRKS